ncbi:glycogen/starch/alpha-glucan phosphorylase [Corynebacterium terpenotabidum]|uniref:Alpha-1,4 glucan phosphorylase n=1 Tax=Corynebacterium terpenotabidum Y-11 TaxID=1200352 RepID=S4XI05_9CORY|nr:glycogen/starch/alpha-glucan phosphorylase [Corynebacterium terpenotabidum]AGP30253.1 glycogen/starch/alpha-glucan phosphorylase [Corynebacterium terpenotabidum Y-11]
MSERLPVRGVERDDLTLPDPTPDHFRWWLLHHLQYTVGKDPQHASLTDWRLALTHTIRDRALTPWFESTRKTWAEDRKRVHYLSMEFLIGRLLEDATINLGLRDIAAEVLEGLGLSFAELTEDEPDAALGNGGLGRLAACYMESMATLGCPGFGYGLRYEHGLFRQSFDHGRQVETPEDWLATENPWNFTRPESAYDVGFGGHVAAEDGHQVWTPRSRVKAAAHDTPVVGYGGNWANTLRLWAAIPTADFFDLDRFNAGEFIAASSHEALARSLSRVLYPNDSTESGKELRLSQEYFLTSASVQDILRRYQTNHTDLSKLPEFVAIQMNDTHPAIAGPELIRLLVDEHGFGFDAAADITTEVLGYTNHTLLPEALERWSIGLMSKVLPRHLQIIERLDHREIELCGPRPYGVGLIGEGAVKMGELAFVTSHKVNGVSALHTDLVKRDLFPVLDQRHPGRILNVTNGVTPRRWLKLANRPLAALVTDTIGEGWETDLDRLVELENHIDDPGFLDAFGQTKHLAKVRLTEWLSERFGIDDIPTDALYDIQVKRQHEYKRQLLNILWTIARWQRIKRDPTNGGAGWVPRVKIFGGKAAGSYQAAKDIIRLINDVAEVVNNDPDTRDHLRVIYPPNYDVSMAEKLIPAADLSEQISTAGMEASGTGNMKFALNGALTIGTLDGANVEIREHVGADNFFLFGLTTDEVAAERGRGGHARAAVEASQALRDVLQAIAEGTFSPGDQHRYGSLVDNMWNSDWFLVASDFDSYDAAQSKVDEVYRDPASWQRKAVVNIARMGFFSSDRSIREYMEKIWDVESAL